jgi:hypothetical protein
MTTLTSAITAWGPTASRRNLHLVERPPCSGDHQQKQHKHRSAIRVTKPHNKLTSIIAITDKGPPATGEIVTHATA